jgi:putative transposase
MLRAYKYRLYPDAVQASMIDKTIGVCRLAYNLALETKIRAYKDAGVSLSPFTLINQFTQLRREYDWIKEVGQEAPAHAILNIGRAYESFFKGAGFPKFKSKRNQFSFGVLQNSKRVDFKNNTINAGLIKKIPARLSRTFTGKIRCIYVTKTTTGKYFASVLIETGTPHPTPPIITNEKSIGIDVGINNLVVTSEGRKFQPNRKLKGSLKRLKCLQRRASRKKKSSSNRRKANLRLSILHEKISNQRIDYLHKVTTDLVRDNQADSFVIEDLNVSGMVKNRRLSQALYDVSFGEFFRQMKYKCQWYGKNLIMINRFEPTSKKCSACGETNTQLTLSDRLWTCVCGATHDRDINAAINIKYSGMGNPGGPAELSAIAEAMKQESRKSAVNIP